MIRLAPVCFTAGTERAAAFFAALGFADVVTRSHTGAWVELDAPRALLCLQKPGTKRWICLGAAGYCRQLGAFTPRVGHPA